MGRFPGVKVTDVGTKFEDETGANVIGDCVLLGSGMVAGGAYVGPAVGGGVDT
jgi:hypothetical protein